jgi:hypothetical protein
MLARTHLGVAAKPMPSVRIEIFLYITTCLDRLEIDPSPNALEGKDKLFSIYPLRRIDNFIDRIFKDCQLFEIGVSGTPQVAIDTFFLLT